MKSREGLGEALRRMEQPLLLWLLLLASTGCGRALLDLTGVQEIEGTWKASVCVPCVYMPSAGFEQETVLWKTSLTDHSIRTIFRRDPISGDQTLLTHFKNRIRVPKVPPGDVSLLIEDLEMRDRGLYTCEVVWVARNKSRMTKERTTVLSVVKVAVTKPLITTESPGSMLPRGWNTSLTCHTRGSPPITYRWFRALERGNEDQVGQNAVLHFDSLQESDTGTYFCEVENQISSAVQRSDAFQLTVKGTVTAKWEGRATTTSPLSTRRFTPTEEGTVTAKWEGRATTASPLSTRRFTPTEEGTVTAKWEGRATTTSPLSTRRFTPTEKDLVPTSREPQRRDGEVQEHTTVHSAPRTISLPVYVIILIAVLCLVVLLAVLMVVFCRRKLKSDHVYAVTYNNPVEGREEASSARCESEQVSPRPENNYTTEPAQAPEYVRMDAKLDGEYEILVLKMESEYEVVATPQEAHVATWRPSWQ